MNSLHHVSQIPLSWGTSPLSQDTPVYVEPPLYDDISPDLESSPLLATQQSTHVMKSSDISKKPFEELMYQVLSILIREEEKATLILRDAICAEKQWQKSLSDLLEKEHSICHTYEKRNDVVHKASDIILPLSLIAEGIVTIFTGGVALLPLGAAAFGAFLLLDTVLDNKAKEGMASLLGRATGEDSKSWFQRICMVTSLTIFGLSMFFQGSQAVTLASTASKVALTCTEAGTEKLLNDQKARLIESEKSWDDSGRYLKELLGDVDRQVKSVNSLFTLLTDLQKSTTQATARIF
jgi:hypothetical protein